MIEDILIKNKIIILFEKLNTNEMNILKNMCNNYQNFGNLIPQSNKFTI
jgi:hypothetical protein